MRENIKIKSVNFHTKVGQVAENLANIKNEIVKADKEKVNILSFPELSLTGASLYHGYLDKNIQSQSLKALYEFQDFSQDFDLLFTVGLPFVAGGKLKKKFTYADKLNVKYAYIIGSSEREERKVSIRNMETGDQDLVDFDSL